MRVRYGVRRVRNRQTIQKKYTDMKCYKYTIDSVGGITTVIDEVPNKIEFPADEPFINIINPKGRIILPMCNVVSITEEEVEI